MASFDTRFESNRTDWETPEALFDVYDAEFHFTLDVAASRENRKCRRFFDIEMNGLAQPWSGVCWCNPPYGRDMIAWLKKGIAEKANGVVSVFLIPARTNTGWFHDLCLAQGEVRFIRGRPKFGDGSHGLPLPLAIVIYR